MQIPSQDTHPTSRLDSAGQFAFPFVTFLGLTLSPGFGTIAAVFFILPSIVLIGLKARSYQIHGRIEWPGLVLLFIMPSVFLASTFWSNHPLLTFKLSAEALVSCCVVYILTSTIRLKTLITAFFFAQLISVGASILSGKTAIIYETQQAAYVGFYGSKNYLAYAGLVLFILSVAKAGISQTVLSRALAYVGVGLALITLVLTISAGAAISFFVIVLAYCALMVVRLIHVSARGQFLLALFLIALSVACLAGLVFGDENGLTGALLSAVGKDATLTGRTDLWAYASRLVERNPLFGIGYQAFWVQNDPEPEALWYAFHIPTRMGFHFHNQFYSTAVELGYFGVAITFFYVSALVVTTLRNVMLHQNALTTFLFQIIVLTMSRIYTEVDLLAPFSIGWILTLFASAYSFKLDAKTAPVQKSSTPIRYPAAYRAQN